MTRREMIKALASLPFMTVVPLPKKPAVYKVIDLVVTVNGVKLKPMKNATIILG